MPNYINSVLDLSSRTKSFNIMIFKYFLKKYDAILLEFDFIRRFIYLGRFISGHLGVPRKGNALIGF